MGSWTWLRRSLAALVAAWAAIPLLAAGAHGQESTDQEVWDLEGRGGVVATVGETRNLADPGPTVGLGLSYRLTPVVSLRGDARLDLLSPESSFGPLQEEGPGVRVWNTTAGVLLRFTNDRLPGWSTLVGLGAGASTFDTDAFLIPVSGQAELFEFTDTYLTTYAELRFGYRISESARLSLGIRPQLIVADEEATEIFEVATDGRVSPFGTVGSFPVSLGLSLGI